MAEFGIKATDLQGPQNAGSTPTQGVVTPASQVTLPTGLMDIGVQVVRDLQKTEADRVKQGAADASNSFLADYTRAANRIDTNTTMTAAEKSARKAALGRQFSVQAAEMGIMDKFKLTHDTLTKVSTDEVADNALKLAQDERKSKLATLTTLGYYVPPDAPDSYIDGQLQQALDRKRYQDEYGQSSKELADQRAGTKYGWEVTERAQTEQATMALTKIGSSLYASSVAETSAILETALQGGAIDKEQARTMLVTKQAEANGVLMQIANTNPELVAPYRTMFNQLFELQTKRLDNPSADIDNQIKILTNKASLSAISDNPEILSHVVSSKLFGQTITGTLNANTMAARVMATMSMTDTTTSNSVPTFVGSPNGSPMKTTEGVVYDQARQSLDLVRSGKAQDPDQTKQEAFRFVNNVIDQLGDTYGSAKIAPESLNGIVDFMNTDQFSYFVKEGGMNPQVAQQATRAFQQQYASAAETAIRPALEAPVNFGTVGGTPSLSQGGFSEMGASEAAGLTPGLQGLRLMDFLDITYSGGSVRFVPKGTEGLSASQQVVIQQKIRELQTAQKAATKLVRVGAHLEGTTNYDQYWEQNKDVLFPTYYSTSEYKIGTVKDGYKLKAFPWSNPANWERVDGSGE